MLSVAYGFLLTFGFIMMTPQLFINYKMKSVAHLPWRMMTYKVCIDVVLCFHAEMFHAFGGHQVPYCPFAHICKRNLSSWPAAPIRMLNKAVILQSQNSTSVKKTCYSSGFEHIHRRHFRVYHQDANVVSNRVPSRRRHLLHLSLSGLRGLLTLTP